MKKIITILMIAMFVFFSKAELINANPDPNGEPWYVGELSPITPELQAKWDAIPELKNVVISEGLPLEKDNSKERCFRQVFNQRGGSCAQASGVGYTFTYEMNALRGTNPSNTDNQYPTHYTYNFLNHGSGGNGSWYTNGWDIIEAGGCPNVTDYGGMWPSEDLNTMNKIWMSGFTKYENGMNNRVLKQIKFPLNSSSKLKILKQWMYDHCDGSDKGGLVVFSAGAFYSWETGVLPENTEHAGEYVITKWHDEVNHAMTFVGYSDDIRWDYNGDHQYRNDLDENNNVVDPKNNMKNWEIGGLKMVNSHGESFGDNGFSWVMYRTLAQSVEDGGIYDNVAWGIKVKESEVPTLKLKATITHTERNDIRIKLGIANDLDAVDPESYIEFPYFKYQGGDGNGMTGDGNTIELGLDISKIQNYANPNKESKYFLVVELKANSVGEGHIEQFSIIDEQGNEYISEDTFVEIDNNVAYATINLPYTPKTYYVNNDEKFGDDTNNGLTPRYAFKTISKAIETSGAGATIVLAGNSDEYPTAGTFTLSEDDGVITYGMESGLNINKSLTIIGKDPESTIIQAETLPNTSSTRVFCIRNSEDITDMNVRLENLTIQNGKAQKGGGIYSNNDLSLIIDNCIISNNHSYDISVAGAGIYSSDSKIEISNSIISDNFGETGGGGGVYIYTSSANTAKIENCKIYRNICSKNGGSGIFYEGRNTSSILINNSLIKNNGNSDLSGDGGGICLVLYGSSSFLLTNTAICENNTKNGSGGVHVTDNSDRNSFLENCTISKNYSVTDIGNAINYSKSGGVSDFVINSCTIVENGSGITKNDPAIYYSKSLENNSTLEIKNSIIANGGFGNFLGIGLSLTQLPITFSRSYTICDDETMPITGNGNYNSKDPCITKIRNEYGTSFFKLEQYSPAKDAIPPAANFNGAGYTDEDGNVINDDIRGFPVHNQKKDIGAYESPYYWIHQTADDEVEYTADKNHEILLHIADRVEYDDPETPDPEKWKDFINLETGGIFQFDKNSSVYFNPSESFHIIEEGSIIEVLASTIEDPNHSRFINGNIKFLDNTEINIYENSTLGFQVSDVELSPNTILKLHPSSKLEIQNGTNFVIPSGFNCAVGKDAEITVLNKGRLETDNKTSDPISFTSLNAENTWNGINCKAGSTINMKNINISNAKSGIFGTPYSCNIANSEFSDCENGISFVNCNNYNIFDNIFIGNGVGSGISLVSSNGNVLDNTIQNFENGLEVVLSVPTISNNGIYVNTGYGLHITGYNAYPQLLPTTSKDKNNSIANNQLGQIFLKYWASANLNDGINNIYSEIVHGLPVSPCIVGASHLASKLTPPDHKNIPAQYNYWGAGTVNEEFFDIYERYYLDFEPYASKPYSEGIPSQIPGNDITQDARKLSQAINFEIDGKIDQSIKKLEKIVSDNESLTDSLQSEEYLIALAKLPNLYAKKDMDLEPLVKIYDSKLESDEESVNKKFFKEMKISAKIKAKKFDEAIILAEEMREDATTDGEVILADIDIAIANMMRDAEEEGKENNGSKDYSRVLKDLLDKLNGNECEVATSINETQIPTKFTLFQNYPNPFNPVTQIKFALPVAGNVKLNVYNINGQLVSELVNEVVNAGMHSVNFNGNNLNSGMYFYTLEANGISVSKKMILTK